MERRLPGSGGSERAGLFHFPSRRQPDRSAIDSSVALVSSPTIVSSVRHPVTVAPRTLIWSAVTVLVAIGAAWRVAQQATQSTGASEQSFHEWLHANLALSAAQHQALKPFEASFEIERERLRNEIRAAGKQLAEGIREKGAKPETVETSLQRLQMAQGELQRATLRHFFQMKDHLDPRQAEQLVRWTHDNLLDGNPH